MPSLRFPASVPTLTGDAVTLRALHEDDIPAWFERATDEESADLAGDPVPESIASGAAWLQRQRDVFDRGAGIRWAIVPAGSSASIGTVALTLSAGADCTAELGIVVARAHWQMGLGTAAARMALSYGFRELGLEEVRAEVLQRNPVSIRMLEKLGFRLVRVLAPTAAEPEVMCLYARLADEAGRERPSTQRL